MLTLKILSEILASATTQEMAACDRMYCADFRGECLMLSECEYGLEDFETTLYMEAAVALYTKVNNITLPVKPDHFEDDYAADSYYYEVESFENSAEDWMIKNYPNFKITNDTLVVEICNYKGEGENGLYLYDLSKHLPVFRSKRESFNQVN